MSSWGGEEGGENHHQISKYMYITPIRRGGEKRGHTILWGREKEGNLLSILDHDKGEARNNILFPREERK